MNPKSTPAEFKALMDAVSRAWNDGDAAAAAGCFTPDALYTEPPDIQFCAGRDALFRFFGGGAPPEPPMSMTWHHLAFDEESQIGFGEYTFQMNRRYHGIVVVRLREGMISNWREYQYRSDLPWESFIHLNPF